MAINFGDNFNIAGPLPIDERYFNGLVPYTGTSQVFSLIIEGERYLGLTVLINGLETDYEHKEYWFKDDVTTLIEKKYASEQVIGDFITGATNLGYFSGQTGIQIINLALGFGSYNGDYISEYNNYYLESSTNTIRLGAPVHDGPLRRAYVNTLNTYSWIFSDIGTWVVINGDAALNVDTSTGAPVFNSLYTEETWIAGSSPISGTTGINVIGSLTTGTTLTLGNPIYNDKANQDLHFRTIINKTPEFLNINYDGNFINFSGVSSVITATNYGSGTGVYSGKTGTNLKFRTLIASGDTTITTKSDGKLIIYSSSDGSANALTGATSIGTGIEIFSGITDRNMHFRSIVGTGDTIVTTDGERIIVDSSGSGGEYNLASPSAIPVGGIPSGTVLTGKTSFELWEELLVPELCGSVVEPNVTSIGLSYSGLVEIDCNISQTVTINFSRGSISPQYDSITPYRSDGANAYCFCGTGIPLSGFQACTALSASQTVPSYDVVIGTQTWGGCTRYDSGNAALSNKGNEYCAALSSGCTNIGSNSIVGVYPLFATTSTIAPPLTQQALQNMSTANNIQVNLVTESGGNKQKFEIPCAWLGIPTSRVLKGVCQWNTVSSAWEYPGGTCTTSLTLWTPSSASETVQGNSVGYCQYTYNSVDRSAVCIRLVF